VRPGRTHCGLGGPIAERKLFGVDSHSRVTAEYALRPLWNAKQPRKALLLAVPPCGPLGGPDGAELVGELIDSYHPDLCVVGGSSERRGCERIGHTLVINPGRLTDGWAAWLDWGRPSAEQVEFVNLPGLVSAVPARPMSKEDIRMRAYLLWEAAGKPRGDDGTFWRQAEKELARC